MMRTIMGVGCLLPLLLVVTTVQAGVVEDWNAAFLQAVRKETPPPCLVSLNLPVFHLSIHRAVQEANQAGLGAGDQEQAAFHAAEMVFQTFFPSQVGLVKEMRAGYGVGASTAPITNPNEVGRARWMTIAEVAVKRTLKEREGDGSNTTTHYVPSDDPGQWRRTPPNFRPPELPHWGKVRPFVIDEVSLFRAPPPPALNSKEFAREFNEVKELGAKLSSTRTAEQTLIAQFWSDFSYTTSPAGHWNDIAREVSRQQTLSLEESARLFALLNLAMADTCIAIWDTKYHYNYWRPVTAIRRAGEDGNSATAAEMEWEPLLATPPHPEYVSGHSGVSAAGAEVLAQFFGTDRLSFEVGSDTVTDVKRKFESFGACALEISRSRVLGGIHFSMSAREGLVLGKRVAQAVLIRMNALKISPTKR